jgi:hypothetical protein
MSWRPAALAFVTVLGASTAALAQAPPPVIPLGPAAAPAAPAVKPNPDLTCMLVANGLGRNSKEAKQREMASLMMIFYLGRVDRATPNLNLGPALQAQGQLAQATQGQPAQVQAQVQNCVNKFNGRMNALGALTRPPGAAAPVTPPATPAPK